jgi:hypothetical protein
MPLTSARVTASVDTAVEDVTHIQLHDGDPGVNGTDNVAAEVAARLSFVFPSASSDETEQVGTFTITGAGGPYTDISLWNALTNGTLQGQAALTPEESFAGAGELEVTVTVTGTST